MRLSFPNGEHADVLLPHGDTRIGSAAGNAVLLDREGIEPNHAVLTLDRRGLIMTIPSPQAVAHVNARRIRERVILRTGDLVSLGTTNLLVKPDRDFDVSGFVPPKADSANASNHAERALTPRVVLRGLAGPYFGKVVPIGAGVTIGRQTGSEVQLDDPAIAPRHVRIEAPDGGIWLRSLDNGAGVQVNGVPVKETILFSGDQLTLAQNRFLLEAPGTPSRNAIPLPDDEIVAPVSAGVTQTLKALNPAEITSVGLPPMINTNPSAPKAAAPAAQESPPSDDQEDRWTMVFLVLTGVVIAGFLAWLLMR